MADRLFTTRCGRCGLRVEPYEPEDIEIERRCYARPECYHSNERCDCLTSAGVGQDEGENE